VQVQCPSCNAIVNHPDANAGQVVNCPQCGGQMQLPAAAAAAPAAAVPAAGAAGPQKACPYCGEMILAAAQKCRHCNTMLTGPNAGKGLVGSRSAAKGPTGDGRKALIYGLIGLLCFGVILGPVAIYYGNRARSSDEDRGLGTAGMILGVIDLLLFVVFLFAKMASMGH
jgi:predicted RNA-binding Zn-ribbon protein involved in translation (DUF1610 family)